jgi:hypothetical protein
MPVERMRAVLSCCGLREKRLGRERVTEMVGLCTAKGSRSLPASALRRGADNDGGLVSFGALALRG